MTENCACITRGWPKDPGAGGSVGGPHVNCEIKLIDVPEMGYSSEDKPHPRGEICVRGDMTFVGYYKGAYFNISPPRSRPILIFLVDPENTKKTIDSEGWTHTGDVGEIDTDGRFKIIDRVKVSPIPDGYVDSY